VKHFSELEALRTRLAEQSAAQARERELARRERERREREAAVFRNAMADAVPLRGVDRVAPPRTPAEPLARMRERDEQLALAQSLSDEIDIERLLETDENLSFRREGVGVDVVQRLRRGQWTVQAQIDLHGKRVDEARAAMVEFLADSQRRGRRCLRIIHGKGLGSVAREPVLKGKVLRWLVQRDEVLAFCQARPNDGGAGALLVLLRGS
jgi:DNA-nicking Smr family endonuclease